ncbi:MAG: hypothetical protein AMK75_07380 [Planctomycetes bacterium SM23_65]|nr:MAG: hypothetical protein AMK75_07380 [Planctomycetes bacterium SM23_65]
MDIYNLVSFVGIFVLMGLAWLVSANRRLMNWRVILWGVALQLLFGMLVFWTPGSRAVFEWLNAAVFKLLAVAQAGQKFLLGPLADPANTGGEFVLLLHYLPTIIFFAAVMSLLYYWRIMPLVVRGFAWVFTRLMRISGAESLCTASNIFVGIESATAVRPYINDMTRSELCTILTAGMATIASSVLMAYAGMLRDVFPEIAGHLISASILSAPAAIVMSKILLPEDGQPVTLGRSVKAYVEREPGAIASIISGAMAGVKLVVGICALLIAFLGLIALVNLALDAVGLLSLEELLGYVFRPVAAIIGVPWDDCAIAGELIGKRLVVTELVPYRELAGMIEAGKLSHPRSQVVIAYALCGFAHVASLAIFVGGIAALVPERRKDLASVGPRALLAATLACLMTGAVAGTFFLMR